MNGSLELMCYFRVFVYNIYLRLPLYVLTVHNIITHTNRRGGGWWRRKKQTGSINVITINYVFDEGKKCNRRKTRVNYIQYVIYIRGYAVYATFARGNVLYQTISELSRVSTSSRLDNMLFATSDYRTIV